MSMERVIGELQRQIQAVKGADVRIGEVTGVDPLTVSIAGSSDYADVRALDGVRIDEGSVVVVLQSPGTVLIVGEATADVGGWRQVGGSGNPAYENGWAVDTIYGGYTPLRFRRRGRVVEVSGITSRSSSLTAGAWTTVFTLPAGARPSAGVTVPVIGYGEVTWRCDITTSGHVRVWVASTIASRAWVSLDGVRFEL